MSAPPTLVVPPSRIPGRLGGRVLEGLFVLNRSAWRVAVVTAVGLPLVYLVALGFGVGGFIDVAGDPSFGGLSYVEFVAPGILMAAVLQIVANEATYPVLSALMGSREYHAMIATPIGVDDIVAGQLAHILARVALCAAAFVVSGALLHAFVSPWAAFAVVLGLLCGWAHAAALMAFAVRQTTDEWVVMVQRFYVVPAFLFAGTFFPVSMLPGALQPFVWVTPLWHATTAARDLQYGAPSPGSAVVHVGYLLLWCGAGTFLAVRRLRRRMLA